ncbi:hypothetical protein SELMODRAFT_439335 [Selaginella moellendorffii]|uniref:MYND-type domain-containing protein n=2 Tax=Selaginella moellendorffii TaxID=88036 RepID=D8R3N8_SELML|nr:zinc finger MYND domain-containing protein 15 [Selaginella moellendorffii]EFJ33313.1 hypothetical protein SELMODRAFT_439335 [Selaginella moellendorffii]|eukprot:XP_002965893.1 zinc finger MYND domain-containing protein 15 [Selaginella moellendorffii]
MDAHLRELFDAFQQHFGVGPGLGRGYGGSLVRIEGLGTAFLKSVFRAAAALHRCNPWKKLRAQEIFGLRIGKDTDWPDSRPPFYCVQFTSFGDPSLNLYRSEEDAVAAIAGIRGFPDPKSIPKRGFLRVTFGPEAEISLPNRKIIKQLGLEIAGEKAFPLIDVVSSRAGGGAREESLGFRNPSLEELRWLYACMRALAQMVPAIQVVEKPQRSIESVMQFIDIQWPAEDRKEWDITCVRVSFPPKEEQQQQNDQQGGSLPKLAEVSDFSPEMMDVLLALPRQCIVCEKEVSAEKAPRCSRCKAVVYCSHGCQKRHWKESHKGNCEVYKAMMDLEEELEFKGFAFPCFIDHSCRWLELLGLHGKGMWRRMCGCFKNCPFGLLPPEGGETRAWGLEDSQHPVDEPVKHYGSAGMVVLSNWADYYDLRGLPAESPVAALLSHPLTVYHIVTALSPFTKNLLAKNKEVVLHYIGPEPELDWMPAFTEISHLLSGAGSLHIIMVGPEVPGSLSGMTEVLEESVKVTYVQGFYQEHADSLPPPHLVVGLNSSLESDGNWTGALEVIKALGVPGFFTDYAETCCLNAKQVLRAAGLHISYPLTPNPFRSPVRHQMPSINVPWYSNGFILGINV